MTPKKRRLFHTLQHQPELVQRSPVHAAAPPRRFFHRLPPISLRLKLSFILFLLFSITVIAVGVMLEEHMHEAQIKQVRSELMSVASLEAQAITSETVQRLIERPSDATADYQNIQDFFNRLKENNDKIKSSYILRRGASAEQLVFVVDDTIDNPVEAAATTYDLSKAPDMEQGFTAVTADQEFTKDEWGTALSGYAPLKNAAGQTVAIIGIDYSADEIEGQFADWRQHLITTVGLSLFAMLLISFWVVDKLVKRILHIHAAVDGMVAGNQVIDVDDRGKDELARLTASINTLTRKMHYEHEQMVFSSILALVNALEARDEYTFGHSSEVAMICRDIMDAMQLDEEEAFNIQFAAALHDIGKIGVPDAILNKNGRLTEEEFTIISEHPQIGGNILAGIPSLEHIQQIIIHHHERYDGSGYPQGLAGQTIPFGSRLIAVADAFQAMISDRPYRRGMPQAAALAELIRHSGTQFDPYIVDVFVTICEQKNYKPES